MPIAHRNHVTFRIKLHKAVALICLIIKELNFSVIPRKFSLYNKRFRFLSVAYPPIRIMIDDIPASRHKQPPLYLSEKTQPQTLLHLHDVVHSPAIKTTNAPNGSAAFAFVLDTDLPRVSFGEDLTERECRAAGPSESLRRVSVMVEDVDGDEEEEEEPMEERTFLRDASLAEAATLLADLTADRNSALNLKEEEEDI